MARVPEAPFRELGLPEVPFRGLGGQRSLSGDLAGRRSSQGALAQLFRGVRATRSAGTPRRRGARAVATRSASKKSPPAGRRRVCASSDPGEFAQAVTPWIPRFALAVTSWNLASRLGCDPAAGARKPTLLSGSAACQRSLSRDLAARGPFQGTWRPEVPFRGLACGACARGSFQGARLARGPFQGTWRPEVPFRGLGWAPLLSGSFGATLPRSSGDEERGHA